MHPSSNGAIKHFVQTFKKSMKASEKEGRSVEDYLSKFLLSFRSTPHATTGVTPSNSDSIFNVFVTEIIHLC